MGFTTKGERTKKITYNERVDVKDWVENFAEAMGWDETDVRNRAIQYYAKEFSNDNLDDPRVNLSEEEKRKFEL